METPRSVLAPAGIRREEVGLVGWLSAIFFVTQTTHGLGLNTADALFFVRFGVEHLPTMILLSGLIVMGVLLAYSAALSSTPTRTWLWAVPIASAVWLVVERVGIALDVGGVYAVVWQSAQVVMLATFTLMWTIAGEVCTTRQAKRLYPVFASAGIAGGIVGNAITGPAADLIGTPNLLVLQAALLVVSGVLVLGAAGRFFESSRSDARVPPSGVLHDVAEGLRITVRTPLIRLAAATALASSLLLFLVVFPFSERVAASFGSEAGVAGFLGTFSAIATAATLIASLVLARRLFARIGVIATLLVLPVTYAVGFTIWLVDFDLLTASLVRGAQWIALNALGATALNALFNVLRGRRRAQVMAFVTAVPTQLGTVAAGAVLLASGAISDTVRLVLSLAIAVGAVMVVLRMRPAYVAALVSAVENGFVDVFTAETAGIQKPTLDADAREALVSGLEHPSPERRRVAVAMLSHVAGDAAGGLLHARTSDPDPDVRLTAFDVLAEQDRESARSAAVTLLEDSDVVVRRRAAGFLADTREDGAPVDAEPLLADPDPHVRAAGARLVGGPRGREVVAALLGSDDPETLRAGLDAAADGARPGPLELGIYLRHRDPGVRRSAAAVLAHEPSAVEGLGRLLDDVSPSVRRTAAGLMARTPGGVAMLSEVLTSTGSVRASEAALHALAAVGIEGGFDEWIDRELDRAELLHRARFALGGADGDARPVRRYLLRVLEARERRLERWILEALGAEKDVAPLAVVARGAWSQDPETRAQALEALDAVMHREPVRRLVRLIEGEFPAEPVDERTLLWELAGDFDPWLRALATRCLYEDLAGEMGRLVTATEGDGSDLVRGAVPDAIDAGSGRERVLDTVGRVVALQGVGLFSGLDPEEMALVASTTEARTYDAGDFVLRRGEHGDEMFVVVDGAVEVVDASGDAFVRGPGEYVGETAVISRRPRSADVIAGAEGVRVLVVAGADLRAMLQERPEATVAMMRTLADRIAEARPDLADRVDMPSDGST